MKTYHFTLPDDEAAVMDETIRNLSSYPDCTLEDAIKIRMVWEDLVRSIKGKSSSQEATA